MKKLIPKVPGGIESIAMVEVFRTNVCDRSHANKLIGEIQSIFTNYIANFDLDDCDRILRVKCLTGCVEPAAVINLIKQFGFVAEVLPGEGDGGVCV